MNTVNILTDVSLFQESMGLIRRLCLEEAVGSELTNKLTENLKETLSDNKVIVIRFEAGNAGSR